MKYYAAAGKYSHLSVPKALFGKEEDAIQWEQLPIHNTLIPKIKCLPMKQSWTAFSSKVDLIDVPTGSSRLTTNLKRINKLSCKMWETNVFVASHCRIRISASKHH